MDGVLVGVAVLVVIVVALVLAVYVALRAGEDHVIAATGSAEEADREAKARSYGIDHGPAPDG